MIGKSVICVVTAVFFVVINTIILFLKPEFSYAKNDQENYCVYFQKWISTSIYMGTIMISIISIFFAVNFKIVLAYAFLVIECLMVVMYSLCRYKGVTVNGENIKVERLFKKELHTDFASILKVIYIPNAKLDIKLKKKESFDLSFNSENFRRFYRSLIAHDVKFKTSRVPKDEAYVYLTNYNITIDFPKTMFREYYQNSSYLRSSRYLFSARSLDNHEYIEGYLKESSLDKKEFIELIKKDLNHNGFKYNSSFKENIDGFEFNVIKSIAKKDNKKERLAYIYEAEGNYFVLYTDFLSENEETFKKKMENAIRRGTYEDSKLRMVRV